MKKFTKIALSALSLASVAAISIAGTVAYLTSTDADINVMTLGNVEIELVEQEWNEDGSELVDFTQDKPLLPYVGDVAWGDKDEDNNGAYRQFAMNNVVDKYVSVKNTGKNDAFVRVWIALEMGEYTAADFNMIGLSVNSANGQEFPDLHWVWDTDMYTTIDGKNYNIMSAYYDTAVSADETTIPSLLQVYLKDTATNETVEKLDGNGNGKYDILVFSQAVQADGFADAETALDAAFGDITTTNHPWLNGVISAPAAYITEGTVDLNDVIILTDDGDATDCVTADGAGVVVNINSGIYDMGNQNNLNNGCAVWAKNGAVININGGEFYCNAYNGEISSANHSDLIYAGAEGGVINIYGGFFQTATKGDWILNEKDGQGTINVYGGTFVNWNPADNVSEGAGTNFVAPGYEVVEDVQANGDIWYTVVKS